MLDSAGYAELLATRPFLLHCVWDVDDAKLESITSNGLERVGTHYTGLWCSREGHVYMGDIVNVRRAVLNAAEEKSTPYALVRIDVAQLEREKINPDEDHFLTYDLQDFGTKNTIGDRHACARFGHEFPPSQWLYEWSQYLGRPLPSLGEWADGVGLGSRSAETEYSIAKGSIAYDGVVPPSALKVLA